MSTPTTKATAEEADPLCLSETTAAALLFDAPWRRFGVAGDSLSAGVGDPTPGYGNAGWSERLVRILRRVRPDMRYLATAKIGATTGQTSAHQLDRIAAFRPDLLHLPCGPNDITRRDPDFDEIETAMRRMYDVAASTGALLTTFTLGSAYVVPAVPDWPERIRSMNDITRRVAAGYGAVVVDMWDHPVNARDNLLSADRIHFSTSGQAVLATEMVKQLAYALSSRRSE
ncbi:SGNH/GDSL hydrolase family protein [Nocardia violaceofusca]|uniref:SGNH/GDSL hydrolase family protein n=1 Tax=Nocardia violaceofusca TaxID=941182 RepID=UPI0007A4C1E9|nr:SGNH/GDSL hydrolase family protein [Nocardia violaceofusca]